MQPRIIYILALGFLASACDSIPSEPKLEVPEPEIISWDRIPQPFPESTYFLFGAGLQDGPHAILNSLLEGGVAFQDAYRPHSALCMRLFLDQLVVVLERPDERMQQHGFTTDPNGFAGGCFSHWEHYALRGG